MSRAPAFNQCAGNRVGRGLGPDGAGDLRALVFQALSVLGQQGSKSATPGKVQMSCYFFSVFPRPQAQALYLFASYAEPCPVPETQQCVK